MENIKHLFTSNMHIRSKLSQSQDTQIISELNYLFQQTRHCNINKDEISKQIYIYKHKIKTIKCLNETCDNTVKFNNQYKGFNKFCCVKCSSSSKIIKEKVKLTNLKLFGTEFASQNKIIKEQLKESNIKKFGVDNIMKLPEIVKKQQQTCYDKFGYITPLQSDMIRKKQQQTCYDKFGKYFYGQTEEFINAVKETNILNYSFYNDREFIIKTFIINKDTFLLFEFINFYNVSQSSAYKKLKDLNIKHVSNKGGYKRNQKGILYYFSFINNNKTYYKIGITNKSVKHRWKSIYNKINIIFEKEFNDGNDALLLEQLLLKKFNNKRIQNNNIKKILKTGNTEIFIEDIFNNEYELEDYLIGM